MVRGHFARQYLRQLQERSYLDECSSASQQLCSGDWYILYNELSFFNFPVKKLELDEEGMNFIESSYIRSHSICIQAFYNFIIPIFSLVWSKTDINGILGRGSMFIFSSKQFSNELIPAEFWEGSDEKVLLDIGAGDGEITSRMASSFSSVFATEYSFAMRRRLRSKGFNVAKEMEDFDKQYVDLISLLNVIDRADRPISLLQKILEKLKFSSHRSPLLLLSIVLPFSPYFEYGRTSHPEENLPIEGVSFEEQAVSFADFLSKFGLEVVSFSKMPYLCEGDSARPLYHLNDAVFVLRAK